MTRSSTKRGTTLVNTGEPDATDDANPPNSTEGPTTAAYDLADTRFRLHENQSAIEKEENGKRYSSWAITSTFVFLILIAALNYIDPPHTPLLWINIGTGIVAITAIIWSGLNVTHRNASITRLHSSRRKLRDAEKNARIRVSDRDLTRILWNYHSDIAAAIDDYRASARSYRTIHNRFQTFIIVVSLLVTAVTTASAQFSGLEWIAAVLSFLVAVSTGILGYFKFRDRGVNLQRAADDLEYEYNSVELGINSYRNEENTDKRLKLFAEKSESIKIEQRKREQQMEQGPEQQTTSGGSEGSGQ
ncbi:DUF4231 domain-containing protein [Spiractinospora alimapuensis]|uniref:DUF4231 domain-containing protein n=1 Tax=Spiractinospora alimapuensis TaxID=2820884 RepID=UPI001F33B78A|nr:DUF4231 domain-containing protein [Spiractinospora alimapuensis]QVQ50482.1 DUF4231 domain-containing protein [Spiractinospora alimapuensis]